MKAVVVVALLALCAFAGHLKKNPNFEKKVALRKDVVRDDIMNFTPEVKDCAYTVELKFIDPTTNKEVDNVEGKAYIGGDHTALKLKGKFEEEGETVKVEYLRLRRADVVSSGYELDVEYGKASGNKFCDYSYSGTTPSTTLWGYAWFDSYTDPLIPKIYMEEPFFYSEDKGKMDFGDLKDVQVYYCDWFSACNRFSYTINGEYLGVKDGKVVGWWVPDFVPYIIMLGDYDEGASEDKWSVSSSYEDCEYGGVQFCTCNDENIFTDVKPVPETCELDDAASTVKAIAALVLAMMVLFF